MMNALTGSIEGVLNRSEMKKIIAGGGNIYCSSGTVQVQCSFDDITLCTDACVLAWGDNCHGCAQFPHQQ